MSDTSTPSTGSAGSAGAAEAGGDSSDQQGDAPEGGQAAGGAGESGVRKHAPKAPPKVRRIKAGDEVLTLSDEDIAREYGKWKGSDAKFREASSARESVDKFMKEFNENPEKVLASPKLSNEVKRKLAEKWMREQIESELDPEDPRDIRARELEARLKEFQDRDAKAEQEKEQGARQEALKQSRERIGNLLREAGKATKLAADPESEAALVREMALYIRAARERDIDVTPAEVASHIEDIRMNQLHRLAHQYDGEQLLEFFGEEITKKIHMAALARIRKARDPGAVHRGSEAPTDRERRPVRMDAHAARQHAKKIMG